MRARVGGFRLVGAWTGFAEGGVLLEVQVDGVGGRFVRRFPLRLGPDEAGRLRYEWLHPSHLLVEGALVAERDTVALEVHRLGLLREALSGQNEAWLTAHVRERLADRIYMLAPSLQEEEALFPVECPAPLVPGRYYHLRGHLSPRFYERDGILQFRFKAERAVELLDTLSLS